VKLVIPPLPPGLFERVYAAAGEKRLWLARAAFPFLLGPAWQYALLAFAYLKLFDNLVDEDADSVRASDAFGTHRALAARIYAGEAPSPALPVVQQIGAFVFQFDRTNGCPLRRHLEDAVESMAIDIARRGKLLSEAEIDANLHLGGGGTLRACVWFAAPDLELPESLVNAICDAYMHADSLIDLEHDLAFGLINVPAEAVARGVDPSHPDERLAQWARDEARRCRASFDAALDRLPEIPSWRVRALARLMLLTKRRKLRRFLAAGGWPRAGQDTEASGSA
jgi:hypothetical protein